MKASKPAVLKSRFAALFFLLAIPLLLAGCTGLTNGTTPPPSVTVSVTPTTASVPTGQTQQFAATVSGSSNTAVTWSVSSATASAANIGTISGSGMYTAPASVPTGETVTVTATSQADTSKSSSATVTVTAPAAITVTLSPKTQTLQVGLTQQFTATVANTTNKAVAWQVNGTTGGNSTVGTISAAGLYSAPAAVPTGGTVTVKAISQADNTKSDTATVTITTAPVISITLAPTVANVQSGIGKQNFTATLTNDTGAKGVTWSLSGTGCSGATCGTLTNVTTTAVTYNAPASVPSPAAVTLKATSIGDTTRSSTAAITVTAPVAVAISPKSATVVTLLTQQFTATVTNASNTAVTWQVNGVTGGNATTGTISATGLYTAPVAVPSGAITVKAISQADSTKSDTATVTVKLPVSVTVSPKTPSVQVGLTQQFTATVANTSNTAVTWQVNNVTGGNATTGTISTTGLYTAPAAVPSGAITVKAISQADNTKSDTATVTITTAPLISITLAPTTTNVQASIGKQNFTATLTNDTGAKGVTWSLSGTGCSGATCGTLTNATTTAVTYNAPASVPSPAAVTLKATSIADTTRTSTAAITVTAPIGVSVAPTSANVTVSLTQNFTATVTNDAQNKGVSWTLTGTGCSGVTCGVISTNMSASGVAIIYTAPVAVPSPVTVTLKATSVADGSKTASATITVQSAVVSGLSVAISPKRGGLTLGQNINFTATVTNDVGAAGVTWSATAGSLSNQTTTTAKYAAPGSAGVVTVTATSIADTTKSASATIGVTDLAGIFTYHNDTNRDGVNAKEYALTPSNVATATFGKLFSCPVDGAVYGQPLWVANVTINSVKHNVVIAATQLDSIYAFDADASPCQTLWHVQLLGSGETYGSSTDVSQCDDLAPEIGIVGTPVVDPATNTVYLVTKSKPTSSTSAYVQRIHALSLIDGTEKFGGPTVLAGTINGHSFSGFKNNQRAGLALVNGKVYVAHASHCDAGAYQGWVFGYTASNLTVAPDVFTSAGHAPTSVESGIWMSGGAPAADSSNNVYVITGNGTFDANSATSPNDDYGDTILKLGTTAGITVSDYFTPSDQGSLNSADKDLGSGGATVLIDPSSGPNPHLVVGGGKEGLIYVLNRDNMGKFSSTDSGAVQKLNIGAGIFATAAFWQNRLYIAGAFGSTGLQLFTFNTTSGTFNSPAASVSADTYAFPGATPSISASGTTNGIVWALKTNSYCTGGSTSCGPAILRAYDATNVATELWTSSGVAGDAAGNAVKFTVPTVANGKVYVGTRGNNTGGAASSTSTAGEIDVYGLKPN